MPIKDQTYPACLPHYSQNHAQGAGDHQSKKCNMRAGRDLSSADLGLVRDRGAAGFLVAEWPGFSSLPLQKPAIL
jgi:hypothetical protein